MNPQQANGPPKYDGVFELKIRPGAGLCPVRGCRNEVGLKKGGLCNKHHQHLFRLRSRKPSAYANLRDSAKKRGLAFTISFDYYCGMLDCAGYWESQDAYAEGVCGRSEILTIDRRDITKGYEPGNLRIISLSLNDACANRERFLDPVVQALVARRRARVAEQEQATGEPECPF